MRITRGVAAGRRQSALGVAEQRQHLVAHDAHDLLAGAEALEDLRIDGPVAHLVDERLDDLEVDVGFEQRHADFPQGDFHRLRRQAHLSPEVGEDVLEAVAERVEHGTRPPGPPGGPVANHECTTVKLANPAISN